MGQCQALLTKAGKNFYVALQNFGTNCSADQSKIMNHESQYPVVGAAAPIQIRERENVTGQY